MTGDEIKALRRTLDLTARQLGTRLGVDLATVLAWEREELFPTKRHVDAMRALLERGSAKGESTGEAAAAATSEGAGAAAAFEALADPAVWKLIRKIVAHAELRKQVEKLAARYEDPAGEG